MTDSRARWTPILEGDLQQGALDYVSALACHAMAHPTTPPSNVEGSGHYNLAEGYAGWGLMFSYLDRAALPNPALSRCSAVAEQLIAAAETSATRLRMAPSLFDGLAGVGWVAEHVREKRRDRAPDPFDSLDHLLFDSLDQGLFDKDIDLYSGMVGLGIYLLERLPRTRARQALSRLVVRLDHTAQATDRGVTWANVRRDPDDVFDLGIPHGVSGIIGLLARFFDLGLLPKKMETLLDYSITWIDEQRNRSSGPGRFPARVGPEPGSPPATQTWGHGDLGVAFGMLAAARATRYRTWESRALDIARETASQMLERDLFPNVGLAQGTAGLAHMFNRMYQATRAVELRDAARHLFQLTLAHSAPTPEDLGFLSGKSGIALALISAATPIEPRWDRVMLLDLSPRS